MIIESILQILINRDLKIPFKKRKYKKRMKMNFLYKMKTMETSLLLFKISKILNCKAF